MQKNSLSRQSPYLVRIDPIHAVMEPVLVTVTTNLTIDTGSTSFSVLIPAITLTSISDQKTFTTEAIVTSHSGPNSIPSTGVHETYHFIPLKGEASFVLAAFESVLEPLTKAANK